MAALVCPDGFQAPPAGVLAVVGARMGELLATRSLLDSVAQSEQAERLQRALYTIADLAGSDLEMSEMLRDLHRIVSELMYAENFYIALYDDHDDSLRFLYFVDLVDQEAPDQDEVIPLSRIERGLSWHLVRGRKPLMGTLQELTTQVDGHLHLHGADSLDWLGVPMIREGEVRGIVVVQSYDQAGRYTQAEMSLLAFVADHILTALERRHGRERLERRVMERTAELALANQDMRREVTERERGERLQAALYRIAELASNEETSAGFYGEVHASVGDLISAKNFYIALLSDDGATVSFPYVVDEHERDWGSRSFGRGLTEYVLRTNQPQLVDAARAEQLMASGEIEGSFVGAPTLVWLGVPLPGPEGPMGVVVVQSYQAGDDYDQRDAELLTFVSRQIASTLLRRRSNQLLHDAYADLERRVEVRTAELREQIAVREEIEARLQHQVMHDSLTNLPNRAYLRDRLERAIAKLRRAGNRRFGLLYVDIDRFKLINDSLGHGVGDAVLKEASQRLASCVREPDLVARLAGDEFCILLEEVQLPETASKVAQRIIKAFDSPLSAGGRNLKVSASIGITVVEKAEGGADAVLHEADQALYRAKERGRNRFELFDPVMQSNAMTVLNLEQGLREALAGEQFVPHFQPLVRLDDGGIVGYEALLRWDHPERGLLAPGEFLQVAEESGLIEPIDWQMFALAMKCSKDLAVDGRFVTLNVSPRLFQRPGFDTRMLALTKEAGFDPASLRLEVTEGMLLGDPDAMVAVLLRLRESKIEAALDDFGTGYSSLGHVHRFPLKMIKIDRSFITPLAGDDSRRSCAVVEAILALGHALGVDIVAEGVETQEQRDKLAAMGCVYAQGYLFGRPQPAHAWARQ
ncbi:bifunctional diguanylate cyclase/phosphodiesterase [Arenimonas soli]|uniref:Bifunctional diguanylate cyclase/phosphodiesterase n=1 Tax=Arenimonas soli TaxID=2269504 RepID=A0ABQ1HAC0_9GAMM|nr:bifunctional diguanylate cyclase/phosphodiesterase [Arenimonas soli]